MSEFYTFEEDGDVFFDIAECFMENGHFKEAEKILSELVQTDDFNAVCAILNIYCLILLTVIHSRVFHGFSSFRQQYGSDMRKPYNVWGQLTQL